MFFIDNNIYNTFLDWSMFFENGLKRISRDLFYSYFVQELEKNNYTLNLYVHRFFCKSNCIYCPYYKIIGKLDKEKIKENINKIKKDINNFIDFLKKIGIKSQKIKIKTISFGGGTPSYIPFQYLEKVILLLQEKFIFEPEEFTIEINPTIEDFNNIKPLKKYKVNRISIGIQTFNKEITILTGRGLKNKDVETVIKKTFDTFGNINIDMIYGLPNQTIDILKNDLEKILILKEYITHISYYPLYIFSNTLLYQNFNKYKNILPFFKQNLIRQNIIDRVEKKGGYKYEKILEYRKNIYNYLKEEFLFYTMDYIVNKKHKDKRHKYQIEYLLDKPLFPLGYGYGGANYVFLNNHNFYIYKNSLFNLFKKGLLGIRLFDYKILKEIFKIFESIGIQLDTKYKNLILNSLEKKDYGLQYYLQAIRLYLFYKKNTG